jgi:hypothetical protein
MENRPIFIAFLVAWTLYVPIIYIASARLRVRLSAATLSHLAPTSAAIAMTYIFVIGHGESVRQLVSGSERGMDLWSLWVVLWPVLLLTSLISAIANFVVAIAALKTGSRRHLPVTIPGVVMAIFAFFAVIENFPDA